MNRDLLAAAVEAAGRVMQSLGEDVVNRIEERVDDESRRLLEEVSRWREHYAIARHV